MDTCKYCKHYVVNTERSEYHCAEDIEIVCMTCDHEKILTGYSHFNENLPSNGMIVENDEGWALIIGPDFGCVNFEQKD